MAKLLTENSNYLLKPGHDLMFQEINEWSSALEFYSIELAFLRTILDKTFLKISNPSNGKEIDLLENDIKQIKEKSLMNMMKKVNVHKEFLAKHEDEMLSDKQETDMWVQHSVLKEDLREFFNVIRKLKVKVFNVVENKMNQTKHPK